MIITTYIMTDKKLVLGRQLTIGRPELIAGAPAVPAYASFCLVDEKLAPVKEQVVICYFVEGDPDTAEQEHRDYRPSDGTKYYYVRTQDEIAAVVDRAYKKFRSKVHTDYGAVDEADKEHESWDQILAKYEVPSPKGRSGGYAVAYQAQVARAVDRGEVPKRPQTSKK